MTSPAVERSSLDDPRTRLLGLTCLALLVAGIAWRWATVMHGGDYRFSLGHVGYSDIIDLYILRDFAAHAFPYIQQPVEYPVLTGLTMWLTSYAPGVGGYFLLNGGLLTIAGMGTFVVLSRLVKPAGLGRYALAPGLLLYGTLNWDMISLFALTAGLLAAERRRFGWCGLSIGVGASYKLYPAFLLPVLAALALGARGSQGRPFRNLFALLGSFVATVVVCNLPLALISPSGWSYFLSFQAERPLDPDAIWSHLPPEPGSAITRAFVVIVILGVAWLAGRVYLNRGAGWQAAALASLLFFLVATRDYSPQYDVWLLPFLAILACPWPVWTIFVAADLTYYVAIFLFLFPSFAWPPILGNPALMLGVGVWGREGVLLMLLVWALAGVVGAGALTDSRGETRALVSLAIAATAVLATLCGVVAGVPGSGPSWRAVALAIEALALSCGVVVGIYRSSRSRSKDALLFASACLVPFAGVVVFNFGGLGSFLIPGLAMSGIGVVEGWVAEDADGAAVHDGALRTAGAGRGSST